MDDLPARADRRSRSGFVRNCGSQEDCEELRICFEGVRLATGEWTLPTVDGGDDPATAAVDAMRATAYPARFQVRVGARRVVIPETVQDDTGNWVAATPLLETRIDVSSEGPTLDVPTGARPAEMALEQWRAALEAATGSEIVISPPYRGITVGGGAGTARDVLVSILDGDQPNEAGYGPNLVWHLVWYEEGQHWILNLSRIWSLEAPSGPPPARPVPAQPPRR
jgi:hypothetical protein